MSRRLEPTNQRYGTHDVITRRDEQPCLPHCQPIIHRLDHENFVKFGFGNARISGKIAISKWVGSAPHTSLSILVECWSGGPYKQKRRRCDPQDPSYMGIITPRTKSSMTSLFTCYVREYYDRHHRIPPAAGNLSLDPKLWCSRSKVYPESKREYHISRKGMYVAKYWNSSVGPKLDLYKLSPGYLIIPGTRAARRAVWRGWIRLEQVRQVALRSEWKAADVKLWLVDLCEHNDMVVEIHSFQGEKWSRDQPTMDKSSGVASGPWKARSPRGGGNISGRRGKYSVPRAGKPPPR